VSRNGLEHVGYGATSTDEYLKNDLGGEPRPEKEKELELKEPRFMKVVEEAASAKKAHKGYRTTIEEDLVRAMEREFAVKMKRGYTPEEVLGYWERFIPDVAAVVPNEVCVNIYSRYATWMAVHRVGTTPENARIIKEAQASGQLEITSGFVSAEDGEKLREEKGKIVATIAPTERVQRAGINGGSGTTPRDWEAEAEEGQRKVTRKFDRVISGLGNSVTYDKSRDPFWAKMIEKGLAVPHKQAEDGLDLDPNDLTLLNAKGKRVEGVTAIGIPAFGATMYGRFPHPEKPGVFGGRILPFTANIVGITGGVMAMVPDMHNRLMLQRGQAPAKAYKVTAIRSLARIGRGALGMEFGQAAKANPKLIEQAREKANKPGHRPLDLKN
jgi:hypothetical protein